MSRKGPETKLTHKVLLSQVTFGHIFPALLDIPGLPGRQRISTRISSVVGLRTGLRTASTPLSIVQEARVDIPD